MFIVVKFQSKNVYLLETTDDLQEYIIHERIVVWNSFSLCKSKTIHVTTLTKEDDVLFKSETLQEAQGFACLLKLESEKK